ncbi:2OG-FeII oxygenase superfamily protein [Aspergillus parasiticus SU-1]|uniref:2OG-FeII oxygenase superfamily protein n=1 Tax=Aspergillus parasiticus (strain ATCC 56775 / NRRL 5862 / SRRC 143 / SU-1) TaxID=1403190 RepID=A0A0F0I3I3_ASPPU|nr:2OG-FeII oxygenase superfamily protein [Aspergillus parasiticus SU-1]
MASIKIPTIDFAKLDQFDAGEGYGGEVNKLLNAACSPGFFYLDFKNAFGTKLVLREVKDAYAASERYFDQSLETKMKDFRKGQPASHDRGYKFCETDEFFEMSSDEMSDGSLSLPEALAVNESSLNSLHQHCYIAANMLLDCLSNALNIPFNEYHRDILPSESGLKLVSEPSIGNASEVIENKHTDSGTFTFLFYEKPGLQINIPGSDEWAFPKPPAPGCAIVYGGNFLKLMSNGVLQSPLHRITQLEDRVGKRVFLAYFLRPEEGAKERLECHL